MKVCLYISGLLREVVEIDDRLKGYELRTEIGRVSRDLRAKWDEKLSEVLNEWVIVLEMRSKMKPKMRYEENSVE